MTIFASPRSAMGWYLAAIRGPAIAELLLDGAAMP